MPKYITLANGKIVEFDDGYTDDEIRSYLLGNFDASELVEDANAFRGASDFAASTGGVLLQSIGGAADIARTDEAAPLTDPGTLAGKVDRTLREVPLIGGALNKASRFVEVAENAASGIGRSAAGLIRDFGPDSAAPIATAIDVGANVVQRGQTERRQRENELRTAEGRQSLEDETSGTFAQAFADQAREMAGRAQDARSDESKIEDMQLASAFDEGIGSGFSYVKENPFDAFSVIGPSVVAFLAGGGIAGRGAKILGAGDELATAVSLQGQGLAAAEMSASGAAEVARSMSDEEFAASPMARQLMADGMSEAQAREEMGRRAYDAALGFLAPTNAALMGAGQALNLNPLESAVVGGKSFSGRVASLEGAAGRLGRATVGAGAETLSESVEEGADKLGQNIGEIGGGARRGEDVFEGVGTAAALGGLIGVVTGGGVGLMTPARVADEVTSRPNEADPVAQAQRDVAAIYAAAKAAPIEPAAEAELPGTPAAPEPPSEVVQNPDGSVTFGSSTITGPDALETARRVEAAQRAQTAPQAAPAPAQAAPAAPAATAPAAQPADELEARLFESGAAPVVRPGLTPEDQLAAERLAQQQATPTPPPSAARGGETPVQDPGAAAGPSAPGSAAGPQSRRAAPPPALLPVANRPPPPTTVPRNLQRADFVTIPPAQTGYAKGVRPMEIGEDAKPYLKKNIDTLPDPKPGQLPTDSSLRYFSANAADKTVPLSALKPSKIEEPGNAAIKRMAATASGVIARRDAIDVRDNGDGTYTILDGNGSYNAARKIGLADMPVRIVEAPAGKEPWRENRGMLTPEQDAQLLAAYEAAAADLPAYTKTLKSLGMNLGGEAVVAPLKGRTRAEQKIAIDYAGDVSQIKDLLRGTLKFETPQQAIDAANKLRGRFDVVKDKDGLSPGKPDKGFGYRDINMVIRMPNGTLAEVQLMTTAMAEAKAEAHKHYEITRALEDKFKKGTATAADKKAFAAAEAAMIKAYSEAAALDSAATISARVTGDQESGLRQSTASTPSTGMALPDGENLTPLVGGPLPSDTNANTSPSLRSMNTTPSPAGGMVTPSNTSATGGSPVSGDGPIVRAVQAAMQALGLQPEAVTFGGSPSKMFGEEGARALDLDARTEGVYMDGRVIIFQDNIANPARAVWVFLHEHSGHHGLRTLLGERYAAMMNYAASNPLVKAIAEDMRREAEAEAKAGAKGARKTDDPNMLTEEALAELQAAVLTNDFSQITSRYPSARNVKTESAPGLIKRVINAIKAVLGKADIPKMTDAEVAQLLRDARSAARTQQGVAGGRAVQSRPERPLVGDRTDVRSLPEGPRTTVAAVTMEEALSLAESRKWAKGRDLKLALQEESQRRQREAGINLEERTQASYRVLVDSVVAEARDALTKFSNAIGWYDTKTAQALAQIALIHPEIATDKRSRVAFVWALAITSNGQRVDKNFEMAEAAYSRWRESGVMPTDIGIGIPGKAINNGLAMYNDLAQRMSPEIMEKMLVTRFTVGEIAGATGVKPGGEAINTPVRGAAIAGPKIGNGFMSNLLGYFDQLTVDRWFMRTWGRMIGKLVEVDQADVSKKRRDLASAVRALSASDADVLRGIVGDIAIGSDDQVDSLSSRINAATAKKEAREALMASEPLEVIRLRGRALNNALDGSIEAPSGPDQREYIRAVFGEALDILQRDNPGLTMADLQAVLWYPEKRLYERAKKDAREEAQQESEEEGYADDDAPDYANAARDLVLSKGVSREQVERAMREFIPSSQTAPSEMSDEEKADFLATYIAPPEQDFSFIFEVAPDPKDAEAMANWARLDAKTKKQITSSVGAAIVEEIAAALGIESGAIKKPVTAMGGFGGEVNSNQIAAFPKTKIQYEQALAFAAVVGEALDQASVVVVDERAPSRNNAIRVAVATGKMEPHAASVWTEITSKIPSLAGEGFTVRGDSLEFMHWTDVSNPEMARMVQSAIDSMEIQTAVSFGEINSTLVERKDYAKQIDGLRPELRENVRAVARNIRSRTKQRIADAATAAADAGSDGAGAARRRGAGAAGRQSRPAADGQPGVRRDGAPSGAAGLVQSRSFPADAPSFRQRKQQADAVSAQGIHYSGVAGLTALDGKFAGSGSAGAERRRFGMGQYGANAEPGETGRRLYFYVQEGDAAPRKEDVVAGNNRYAVRIENLYDYEADPRGLREEAGSNMDYLEELVNDAGFDGLLLPPLAGIDGSIAILHGLKKKVPVISAPLQSRARRVELDEDQVFDLIQSSGLAVQTMLDAQKAMTNGDAVFVTAEMDEDPMLATSLDMLDGYTPDQVVVVPRAAYEQAAGGVMQSRAPQRPEPGVPTPLYADRPVVNDGGLRQWAINAGLADVLPSEEMHVTVTYSRAPVDVANVAPDEAGLAVRAGGRAIQLRSALAMPVASMALQRGHRRYRDAGASHDYGDQYTPHITLKYDPTPEDIAALEAAPPFTGTIQLGPERQDVLKPQGQPVVMQSRAAKEARATAAQLRQRKSQLARELTSNMMTAEQVKSWTNRARLLIGEVAVSPDFAQELADAKRALGPERRAALAGDRKALAEYDNIRDMIGVIDEGMRNARAKQAEANRLLDKVERRTSTMSLAEREALVEQLAVALDSAEMAYVAAKRIADWRSKNDAKIVKAKRKRTKTLDYLASEGFQQGSFLWQSGDLKEKAASVKRKFRRALQDRMIDMRDVQEQIERELGITLDDMQNVYRQENLMHGRVADAIDGFRQRLVDPLKKAIKDSGMSMATVEEYLWARHAEERNAKIRSIRPGVDDGSGMTDQQARDILARFTPEQNVQLARISRLVDAIRRNTLETMVNSGQLDRAGADTILASYKHYVPLRGKDGEGEERVGGGTGTGQGISAGRSGVQRALGRKTPPKNILAELVGDSERAIVQAGKAEVGRSLLRLALSYPNKDLWEVEPVELRPKFNESTGEVYLEIVNDDSSSVIVKHNGKPYKVAIKHPRLVAALRNTGTEGMQWIVQYFGALNRWLSAVFTRFNPGFVPVNMARDILQGVTGIAAELGAASAAKVAGYYGKAGWASLKDARSQRGDSSVPDDRKSMEDWAREFAESGGKTGYTAIDDADKMQRDIEQSMMSIWQVAKDNKLNVLGTIGTAFERTPGIKAIEDLNEAVENALRLATYTHLRKDKGWTRQRAAEYAKEMTVNFNRKGTVGSVVNALYLFFNAAVQGSRRTIKLMKHPKVQVVLGGLMAGQWLLATSLGMATFGDDDETLWEKIPDHVKRRSFVIPIGFTDGGTARYISIPMPFGFNIFPSAGGYLANYSSPNWRGRMGDDVGKHFVEAFAYTSSTAIDALSPVPIGEEGFMYPTLVGIGVDLARNRDDLGRRIRPSDEFSQFDAPRAGMANPGTASPFIFAAKALNRLGGGDDYNAPKFMPGLLDVSPNELEYLFNTFTGGPGTTLTQGWRAAAREVSVGDMASFDIPVVRAVSGGVRPEQREAARFYDNKDRVERNLERLRDAYAEGGVEAYEALQRELGPAYADIGLKVRKRTTENGVAGEVMVNDEGRPQFEAPDGSLLDTYREAKRDLTAINREIRRVFNDRSIGVVERQRRLVELQREREQELRDFNRMQSRYDASRGSE